MKPLRIFWAALLSLTLTAQPVLAQGLSPVRDAEIEAYIRDYARPIWIAAGLDPNHVAIHLVNNDSLNAFVAAGQRIFIFTGLITAAEDPRQIIGVLAHETGHITGGHLARTHEAISNATTIMIIGMLLGAAAMAAGAPDAGAALLGSAPMFAERNFLSYSRTQEASADLAALQFLTASGQSAEGLITFFEYLGDQEALLTANKDPYVRSHPLTTDRITSLRTEAEKSPYWLTPASTQQIDQLERMKAKIYGFLKHPKITLRRYPPSDRSVYGRYARAVAYHRQALTAKALSEMDSLIREKPDDPYFQELLGQILFEGGKIADSIGPYRRAVALAPNEPLFRVGLAQSLVSLEDKKLAKEAVDQLRLANIQERDNPYAWFTMARGYSILGDEGKAALASAEYYALTGSVRDVFFQARKALQELPKGTRDYIKAEDLMLQARNAIEDNPKAARKAGLPAPQEGDKKDDDQKDDPENHNGSDDTSSDTQKGNPWDDL